jgi:hypothetical protein
VFERSAGARPFSNRSSANQAELPLHRKRVGQAPVFDDPAALDALDVYLIDLDLLAGR